MPFARLIQAALVAAAVFLAAGPLAAAELDKVRFGTNWVAQPEQGGFYQALADGAYRRYGLDVAIVPGGPHVNNRILLPVGRLDFFMRRTRCKPSTRSRRTCRRSSSRPCSRKTHKS